MNVMKRAHQLTIKRWNAKLLNGIQPASYKVLFAIALRDAHKEYKTMIANKTTTVKVTDIKQMCIADTSATDFVIEGCALDSEGMQVDIAFSTGNESVAQKEAEYYLNSENGFSKVDIYLVMHYVDKNPKEFKIVK